MHEWVLLCQLVNIISTPHNTTIQSSNKTPGVTICHLLQECHCPGGCPPPPQAMEMNT